MARGAGGGGWWRCSKSRGTGVTSGSRATPSKPEQGLNRQESANSPFQDKRPIDNAALRGETPAYAAVVSAIVIGANKPTDALARH